MKIINTEKSLIKLWIAEDEVESGAMEQIKNIANLPFVFKHIAIMPDTHQGFGMPIGGVMATKDVVVPNSVGVDIGCGMCAIKTSLTEIDRDTLKNIMGEIRKVIPVGFNKHNHYDYIHFMPNGKESLRDNFPVVYREYDNAVMSIGTLGGGNHFIEIQKGSDGNIWVMIHSGSRNLGKQVAEYYNKLAIELNEKWYSYKGKELAFLPVESEAGQSYIKEMNYCVDFALANRKLMINNVLQVMESELWKAGIGFDYDPMINIAHNYAALESHFGENVWVHRKGATLAREGTIGIIPGSQGSKSYIVIGKGNIESFMSCSHGAGRKMGRNEAIKNLNLEEEIEKLNSIGVIHGIINQKDLDEASGAYKNIDEVMENQKDLVDILVELTPLAVIKG